MMQWITAYMRYGYGFYFDWTYLLVIIGMVLCLAASAGVNSTYKKYAKVRNSRGMTGAEAAQRILSYAGITDVQIGQVGGTLSDHYDPSKKVLNLSPDVYGKASVAAVCIAAHECGHAIQHNSGYVPLTLRSTLVPLANIGSRLAWPLILIGIVLGAMVSGGVSNTIVMIGILMFSLAVLFQIVTLPVEFNASSRALKILDTTGMLGADEMGMGRKVLRAAALTYVAAAASSILQLLRLLILFGGRRND